MRFRGLLILFLAIALLACSGNDHAGGGSSVETENMITAKVLNTEGKPISGAQVQIRATWFYVNAFSDSMATQYSRNLITDKNGVFVCNDLPQGNYLIHIIHEQIGAMIELNHQDTITETVLKPIHLSVLGSVTGFVNLPENKTSAQIHLFGVDRVVNTDGTGFFRIDSIPTGTIRIRATVQDSLSPIAEALVVIRSGYELNAGILPEPSLSLEDPMIWRYSHQLVLDSLISDWMQPISDPTVVIIRLDSLNFDFTQAMQSGHDIRFYDATGALLPYQRRLWNYESKQALIMVRVSMLSTQDQIEMRWGSPGALDRSTDSVWNTISDSLRLELNSVLVGDFESRSALTNLKAPIQETYWYVFPFDSTVSFTPTDWLDGIVPRDDEYGGSAVHLSYMATDNKWIFIGASLSSTPKNFSALDSIVFWIKGDGLLTVSLDHVGDSGGKAVYNDSLHAEWTRMSINPSMFLAADGIGGNIGWEAVKDSITSIAFFIGSGTEFWIDDVRIYGLNRDDLK